MTWIVIVQQIFEVCIIPLLGLLTAYIISYIKTKKAQVIETYDDELVTKYVELLDNTICSCVIATNQTYVNALKAEGKFDLEAQKVAFQKTSEAVLAILTDDAKTYLTEAFGDLNVYIQQKIEAEVNNNK